MFTTIEQVSIGSGFTVKVESVEILPGVKLSVYDGVDGILNIGGHEVGFSWTPEASKLFSEIDTCEPIELLSLLAQNDSPVTEQIEGVA